jgi:hypothetical protein
MKNRLTTNAISTGTVSAARNPAINSAPRSSAAHEPAPFHLQRLATWPHTLKAKVSH